ncbi:hypothetical protein C8R45DRAFT_927940 [Mycena sanguinolenta]|nr:hypothetical protein C8R45DRAFT_927940 [Mycena sanguinolenta]
MRAVGNIENWSAVGNIEKCCPVKRSELIEQSSRHIFSKVAVHEGCRQHRELERRGKHRKVLSAVTYSAKLPYMMAVGNIENWSAVGNIEKCCPGKGRELIDQSSRHIFSKVAVNEGRGQHRELERRGKHREALSAKLLYMKAMSNIENWSAVGNIKCCSVKLHFTRQLLNMEDCPDAAARHTSDTTHSISAYFMADRKRKLNGWSLTPKLKEVLVNTRAQDQ